MTRRIVLAGALLRRKPQGEKRTAAEGMTIDAKTKTLALPTRGVGARGRRRTEALSLKRTVGSECGGSEGREAN